MREFSVPALVEISETDRLSDVVAVRATREPQAVALRRRRDGGWVDVTCQEFHQEVAGLAAGLVAAGIAPGDRVAVMSRTRYEWTLLDYAAWTAGAVVVPIYETSSTEQVEWILSDSAARAVFVETDRHEETVRQVLDRLPSLRHVWRITDGALAGLRRQGEAVSEAEVERRRVSRMADDLATVIYTSGTTGRPKGCEITHRNLLFDVRNAVAALPEIFEAPGRSTLLFLPLAHVFARIIEVGCLESRTPIGHTADIKGLLDDLQSFQPTFVLAVPRVFEKVYNGAEQKADAEGKGRIFRVAAETAIAYSRALDTGGPAWSLRAKHAVFDKLVYGKLRAAMGGRVRFAISGGAPLGERLGHFFRGLGLIVIEGWGLTETTAATTANRPAKIKIGTVGQPIPGTAARVASDGEILVKGDNVFRGYWNNPEATKEALDAEGWMRTGDMGEIDDDGFVKITGRKKEIIVTAGGKNVAPAVLEDRLRAHPLISQCMVVGDGRPFIACLVTLDPEALAPWKAQRGRPATATVAELRDDPELVAEIERAVAEANKAVSRAEAIKKFRILDVDFTEEAGYLTPTLKVKRNLVTRDFAKEIDDLYR